MVDGGFFLAVISGNGKAGNDPETMRQTDFSREKRYGITKGLAQ